MSVDTIKAQLPLLWMQIPGIKNALENAPNSLIGLDLPLALSFPGSARYDKAKIGNNMIVETRNWLMRLYVAPVQSGVPGEAESLPSQYIWPVAEFFNARPSLGGLPGMQNAMITADTGLVVRGYGSGDQSGAYVCVEFTLTTEEVYRRSFASGE